MTPEARVGEDIEELREIAEWFRLRGKDANARFLLDVADRYEIMASAHRAAARLTGESRAVPRECGHLGADVHD